MRFTRKTIGLRQPGPTPPIARGSAGRCRRSCSPARGLRVNGVPRVRRAAVLLCAVAFSLLAAAGGAQESIFGFPTAAMVTPTDSAFVSLANKYFAWHFSVSPVSATYAGIHDYDGRLNDMNPSTLAEEERTTRMYLDELRRIDPSGLSQVHYYDYLILKNRLERSIFMQEEIRSWERSPLVYTDITGSAIRSLLSREFAPWDVRLGNVILRLRQFPRLLEQAKDNIKSSPGVFTEVATKQNAGCISYIETELAKAAEYAPGLRDSVKAASAIAIEALQAFGEFLERDLLPRSDADYRLGKKLYDKKFGYVLDSDVTPEELVAQAWKRYAEVRAEAIELSRELHDELFQGHTHGNDPSDDEEIAREVFAEIAKDHVKAEEQLAQCKGFLITLEDFIREKDLITLPVDEKLEVEWTPEFERGVAAGGLESPGPFERNLKSFFYVAPAPEDWSAEQKESYLREYNDYMQQIFCIHEALPGHFVQGWYENQFPSLVRALLGSGPFVEGWAVYSEQMMLDAGYADYDAKLQLSRHKWLLRVIINTIIDVGLHTGSMSEEEALDLMIHGGFQEESEARNKIVRASVSSVQLTTYFAGVEGVLEIERLYRKKVGDSFNQKAFNEKLLSFGAPPLRLLKKMMLEEETGSQ